MGARVEIDVISVKGLAWPPGGESDSDGVSKLGHYVICRQQLFLFRTNLGVRDEKAWELHYGADKCQSLTRLSG